MSHTLARILAVVLAAAGCRGTGAATPAPTPAPAAPPAQASVAEPQAAPPAWPDAGAPVESTPIADAGLDDIGIAPCEVLVGRLMQCPHVPPHVKHEVSEQMQVLRQRAQNPSQRRETAGTCLGMDKAFGPKLLEVGC